MYTTETKTRLTSIGFDFLIGPRLADANIILFKRSELLSTENLNNEISIEKIIAEVRKDSKRELLTRNRGAILSFLRYCIDPLTNAFAFTGPPHQIMFEHMFLATELLGYHEGYNEIVNTQLMYGPQDFLFPQMRKLFTTEEFRYIGELLKETIIQLPKQCHECKKWMIDHPKHEQDQVNALKDLYEAIQTKGKDEISKIAKKSLDACSPTLHGEHSILRIQSLEKLGLLTTAKEMIVTVERIMNMLDILYHADYFIKHQDDNPELIEIKSRF